MSTIAVTAFRDPDFRVLVSTAAFIDSRLPGTNLLHTLNGTDPLTVFAPTNAAFAQLAVDLGFEGNTDSQLDVFRFLVKNVAVETLRDVVLYHVSPGAQTAADIAANPTLATALGATITATIPTLVDNEPDLQDPTLVATDIHASNGIIHVIDRVLLPIDLPGNDAPAPEEPPLIVEIAAGNADFSILVDAINFIDANLDGSALAAAISSPESDLTVFAPTNAAFGQLAVDLGFTGDPTDTAAVTTFLVTNVPVETLDAVVKYHISGGEQTAADITAAGTIATLQGGSIDASDLPNLGDAEPDLTDPMLIATDIDASNGIVHIIDRVLLPIDLPGNEPVEPETPNIVGIASSSDDFAVLLAAIGFIDANLAGSDLAGALSAADADLTVFAPTNAAFGQLAADLGFEGDVTDTDAVATFLVTNVPVETLDAVVKYHVSLGTQTAADIAAAGTVATLQGGDIDADELPTLGDKEPDLIDPSLVATDIAASNGIVHVIDRVLLPVDLPGNDAPTITGIAVASGEGFDDNAADFDILREAVIAADLAGALDDPAADLTVFAPTDAAFVALAQNLGFEGSDEGAAFAYIVDAARLLSGGGDPIPLIKDILLYHVAPESLQASQVLALEQIPTLLGVDLGRDGTSLVDNEPDLPNPNLIVTDIQAANGIVHAVDGVLIPLDLLQGNGENRVDFVIGDDGFDFIRTGADNDLVDAKGGSDFVRAGSGDDLVLAGAGRDKVFAGSGDDVVKGEAGRDFIFGGRGDDDLDGGDGNDFIKGGSGNDVITAGAGRDHVTGGGGDDVFVFNAGDGHNVIHDFGRRGDNDQIDLSSFGFESFAEVEANIKAGFFNTKIDLADTDIILFGTRASTLTEDDFIL